MFTLLTFQFLNQTQNAFVNHYNRPTSKSVPFQQIAQSYGLSLSLSLDQIIIIIIYIRVITGYYIEYQRFTVKDKNKTIFS